MRLANKVAIITGAASGIGKATAIRFAQEGAMAVIADIDEGNGQACTEQITAAGNQAAFIKADVGLEADLRQMVDFAVSTFGGVDIIKIPVNIRKLPKSNLIPDLIQNLEVSMG